MLFLVGLITCGLYVGSRYMVWRLFETSGTSPETAEIASYFIAAPVAIIGGLFSKLVIRNSVTQLFTYLRIRRATEALVRSLGM
jgi:hypothetical protein